MIRIHIISVIMETIDPIINMKIILRVQIEIRCKGRPLEPLLTLQHVRDQIWSSRQAPADYASTTPDNNNNSNNNNSNVMVLHYGRS